MRTAVLDRLLPQKSMLPSMRGQTLLVMLIGWFCLLISAGCDQSTGTVRPKPIESKENSETREVDYLTVAKQLLEDRNFDAAAESVEKA